jgi:hypothetical protein
MIAQHQVVLLAQVRDQTRLLVIAQGDALVVVVSQVLQNENGLLREGQNAILLRRHGDAVQGVGVQYALDIVTRAVNGAVNGEARRIDRPGAVAHFVSLHVDFDQAGSGDLIEHHAVGIDEKVEFGSRHAGGDVGEDQVIPMEMRDQPIGGSQVDANCPLFRREAGGGVAGGRNGFQHGALQ